MLRDALSDRERGMGSFKAEIGEEVIDFIAGSSAGDGRSALNSLEAAFMITEPGADGVKNITLEAATEAMQKKALLYDKSGEEHYNVISAFIKSMRGSDADAAPYWLAPTGEAGEEPPFIARRKGIFPSD